MKVIRTFALAVALTLASCTSAQIEKLKGLDLGACSPKQFIAAHFDVVGKDLKMTLVSQGPGRVDALEEPSLYVYDKTDADGQHYKHNKAEMVLVQDKESGLLSGGLIVEGEPIAILIGVEGDGKDLAKNAQREFNACVSAFPTKTQEDPSIVKAKY